MYAILIMLLSANMLLAQPWQWILTNPNWQNPTNFPQISPEEIPVCLADVNGDGLTDVLQFPGRIQLFLQHEGAWGDYSVEGPIFTNQYRVTGQNLDSDAAQELVFFPTDTSDIRCFKFDMNGEEPWHWDERPDLIQGQFPTLITMLHTITWGNFDQDEYEEAAVLQQTIYFEDALFVYQRTAPDQPWTSQNEFVLTGMIPHTLYSGDFDHDGDTDLAVQAFIMDDYEGTMIFENSPTGIQWNYPDSDLLSPGGGDLDGDGEWEFLYVNTCNAHLFFSMDGPYILEWNALHDYSFGRNSRAVSAVIGRLSEPEGSYVAGVSTFFCFNNWWNPANSPHSDVINLTSDDYRRLFTLPNSPYAGLSMADIDGDGLRDLVGAYYSIYGWYDVRWSVLMNVGDEFSDAFASVPGTQFIIDDRYFPEEFDSPRIGDIDGDNHAELILYRIRGDDLATLQIFRIEQLNPEQILARAPELELGLPDSILLYDVTDLDGDGLAEIILIENRERFAYFFRNGRWETYAGILPEILGDIRGFADWDNNGTMDIFADDGIYLNMNPSAADHPVVAPSSFKLSSYPNPFNAQTTIAFDLPRAGDVSLRLFDLLGREVETVLQQHMNAGTHTLNYDAAALPSGVYFVRLEAADVQSTHKLLLLK